MTNTGIFLLPTVNECRAADDKRKSQEEDYSFLFPGPGFILLLLQTD
jgi:hypothetical protein